MARTLRIQSSDAYYHVMNRGLDHQTFAQEERDYEMFLRTLMELHECFGVKIYAFCLMSNHYHLLIRTPQLNLSRAMRHFGHTYTQRYNLSHDRDGPLFRGRFRSLTVLEPDYFLQLVRYIHLNPVEAGLVTRAEDYKWSSFRNFFQPQKVRWLEIDFVMNLFGPWKRADQQELLKKFVNRGNQEGLRLLYERRRLPPILGSDVVTRTLESGFQNKRNITDLAPN